MYLQDYLTINFQIQLKCDEQYTFYPVAGFQEFFQELLLFFFAYCKNATHKLVCKINVWAIKWAFQIYYYRNIQPTYSIKT